MRGSTLITGLLAVACCALSAVAARAQAADPATPRVGNPHGDMSLDCKLCHSEQTWIVDAATAAFDHDQTGFPLDGLHAFVDCRGCHEQPNFAHIGTQCADCHMDAHKGRLGPNCNDCHTPDGWIERTRQQQDHDMTRLPLVGAHAKVDCDACHQGAVRGEYVGTPSDCYACHSDTYAATSDPDHLAAGFTTDCDRCHGVFSATWGRGDFIHSPNFPLTGAHASISCVDCHSQGFAGTPVDCATCHQPDFDATTDPPHVAAGFSTECAVCHSTRAWQPSSFDHAATGFALEGGHRGVDCRACHESGYVGTPADCYACHRTDYETAADPNHVTESFPTDCAVCHSTTAWTPAAFDHNLTAFPLTGAHRNTDCASCHAAGYAGTPTDCYACHQADYQATNNPDHLAANFPTTCATCHGTAAWEPANWDHEPLFPINSGAHSNISCTECHVVPSNYADFECILCHEHTQSEMDPKHREVRDYQFLSAACYECHPRGRS